MSGERWSRWERILYLVILTLALFSRFYMLGTRAISHDESIHTKISWDLYQGSGFRHDPMMHGPLLFEVTAFNYFLFGVSDFSARIFPALVGVALVMSPLLFRRWLGRSGALAASFLLLISPSISYYSRYIRHDAPLMLAAVLWLWTMLKYLEDGKYRWLYLMTAAFSLMYTTKEASYIYTAIFLGLFALPFLWQVARVYWKRPALWKWFLGLIAVIFLMGGLFVVGSRSTSVAPEADGALGAVPLDAPPDELPWWARAGLGGVLVGGMGSIVLLYYGVGEETMQGNRLFDLLMAVGTLTLPLGAALLMKYVGGLDMDAIYQFGRGGSTARLSSSDLAIAFTTLGSFLVGSIALGLWWDRDRWPIVGLIHYAILFVFYSTFFTWGFGVFSGMVGGLAYWLIQQGVKRGGQPGYYYLIVGGLYEYFIFLFAAAGGLVAGVHFFGTAFKRQSEERDRLSDLDLELLFPIFLLGWSLISWIAYTIAGEKMPWLLVHITLPNALLAAWLLGRLVDAVDWAEVRHRHGWVLVPVLPLALLALVVFAASIGPAIQTLRAAGGEGGWTFAQLPPLGRASGGLVGLLFFGVIVAVIVSRLRLATTLRVAALTLALFLSLLTVRTSTLLNYVNYDLATEYLVFAHGAPGIKAALSQIRELSWRLTGTPDQIQVAYGEKGSWPFIWYMVDYPNAYYYGTSPAPDQLLDSPAIIAGSAQWAVVENIVGDDYVYFPYQYLWWPIEDYRNLTWARIRNVLTDPQMRAAVWEIVWKRDYTRYAQLNKPEDPFDLSTWPLREDFRLYVPRNLAEQVWRYQPGEGGPQEIEVEATVRPDPFEMELLSLPLTSGANLTNALIRGIAVAPDGTLYAADVANHRIWHVTAQGAVLDSWGEQGSAPGQFEEPWDVAVGPEGEVYVADTWNHRVQKFSSDGTYLDSWGFSAQVPAESLFLQPKGFFGPRGVAVGPEGEVYVTDTGNKRVQVFDTAGQYLRTLAGDAGSTEALNEPVGVAVNREGEVYVADTWNRRIVVFGLEGRVVRQWEVPVWGSENPEEKPYLAVDDAGHVYVSDPVNGRLLAFGEEGKFLWAMDGEEVGLNFVFLEGVAVKGDLIYVSDAHTGQILGFRLP